MTPGMMETRPRQGGGGGDTTAQTTGTTPPLRVETREMAAAGELTQGTMEKRPHQGDRGGGTTARTRKTPPLHAERTPAAAAVAVVGAPGKPKTLRFPGVPRAGGNRARILLPRGGTAAAEGTGGVATPATVAGAGTSTVKEGIPAGATAAAAGRKTHPLPGVEGAEAVATRLLRGEGVRAEAGEEVVRTTAKTETRPLPVERGGRGRGMTAVAAAMVRFHGGGRGPRQGGGGGMMMRRPPDEEDVAILLPVRRRRTAAVAVRGDGGMTFRRRMGRRVAMAV